MAPPGNLKALAREIEEQRIRPHYFNLTRKEMFTTTKDMPYIHFRCLLKDIGWSSKDEILYFDNYHVGLDDIPLIYDEERKVFTDYVNDFKNLNDELKRKDININYSHLNAVAHMRSLWFKYLKNEFDVEVTENRGTSYEQDDEEN